MTRHLLDTPARPHVIQKLDTEAGSFNPRIAASSGSSAENAEAQDSMRDIFPRKHYDRQAWREVSKRRVPKGGQLH